MAEALQPCCERARREYLKRLRNAVNSYPVIKDVPCPTCKRIIPIRLYTRPDEAGETT
jgi:hypothetical protein